MARRAAAQAVGSVLTSWACTTSGRLATMARKSPTWMAPRDSISPARRRRELLSGVSTKAPLTPASTGRGGRLPSGWKSRRSARMGVRLTRTTSRPGASTSCSGVSPGCRSAKTVTRCPCPASVSASLSTRASFWKVFQTIIETRAMARLSCRPTGAFAA